MIAIITITAVALALLLGVAVAATLGEHVGELALATARRPVKIALAVRPSGLRISPPLPRI